MPSSGFTRLGNLPGRAPTPKPQSASDSVQSFQNQQLPGLSTGTQRGGSDVQSGLSPSQQLIGMRSGQSNVQLSAQRTTDAVRATNQRLSVSAQLLGAKKRQAAAQAAQRSSGGYKGRPGGWEQQGGGGGGGGPVQAGPAVSRIQGILKNFPGLRITEVGGNREYDVAHGVPRVPTSYHYDKNNPAIDIAGSTADLDRLYRVLVQQGGWRQILWRTEGHWDHLHVAADGGIVGDPGPMGTKTIPMDEAAMTDLGTDTEPAMLSPGEVVVTKEAADAIGPENLIAANKEMASGDSQQPPAGPTGPTTPPGPAVFPGMDVAGLAQMAYKHLGSHYAGSVPPGTAVPGVRTALRNLRPGDLVAWKDGSHIAVYAGNGDVMVSTSPAQGPQKRPLWAPETAVYGIALRLPGE